MADPTPHKENILFSNLSTLYFDTKKKITHKKFSVTRILTAIILISTAATFLLLPFIFHLSKDIKFDTLGVYGDFFGSFTSLFTILAFAGLIISLYYQRRDLELQRKELNAQVKEMKDQADAQKSQAQHMANQFKIMAQQFDLSKSQLQSSQQQATLMEQQVKSMMEQTEQEMRPYLNVYIDFNNHSHALLIKNIGRTACTKFKMTPKFIGTIPSEFQNYANSIINSLKNFELDIIPVGMEYAIELDDISGKGTNLCNLYDKNIVLEITFTFKGLGKKDRNFTVQYNLGYDKTPTRRSQFGFRDICNKIDSLTEAVNKIPSTHPPSKN